MQAFLTARSGVPEGIGGVDVKVHDVLLRFRHGAYMVRSSRIAETAASDNMHSFEE
jgi:hypothetical protein